MPFMGADIFLGYVRTQRVAWFDGEYGSGKTALAFRTALWLAELGIVRHIVSNLKSPICTPLDEIELRPGNPSRDGRIPMHADVAVVLDEAGTFIQSTRDTDGYLAALRKLNIYLLLPSVEPLPLKLAKLVVERTYNWAGLGVPIWQYGFRLRTVNKREKSNFFWRNPTEIYGVYDTIGYPTDDSEIKEYMGKWTKTLAVGGGYNAPKAKSTFYSIPYSDASGETSTQGQQSAELAAVEALGRVADAIESSAAQTSGIVSVLDDFERSQKRRRKR